MNLLLFSSSASSIQLASSVMWLSFTRAVLVSLFNHVLLILWSLLILSLFCSLLVSLCVGHYHLTMRYWELRHYSILWCNIWYRFGLYVWLSFCIKLKYSVVCISWEASFEEDCSVQQVRTGNWTLHYLVETHSSLHFLHYWFLIVLQVKKQWCSSWFFLFIYLLLLP